MFCDTLRKSALLAIYGVESCSENGEGWQHYFAAAFGFAGFGSNSRIRQQYQLATEE